MTELIHSGSMLERTAEKNRNANHDKQIAHPHGQSMLVLLEVDIVGR